MSDVEFRDEDDEFFEPNARELVEKQTNLGMNRTKLNEEDAAARAAGYIYASPKKMLPSVLRAFGRLLTCTARDNVNAFPEDLTNRDYIALLNLQFKAASTLIKHIVPTLKATANINAELDEDVMRHLTDMPTERLAEELHEMERKLDLPNDLGRKVTHNAVDTINVFQAIKQAMPDTRENLKKAAKRKNRTSGSPRRKVVDVESTAGSSGDEGDIQGGSEEEAS